MWLALSIVFAGAVGAALAFGRARKCSRVVAYATLFLLSVFVQCFQYFGDDPGTWMETYVSGILLGGCLSIVFHVVPAVAVDWAISRRRQPAET